jgi:hypothetical protein
MIESRDLCVRTLCCCNARVLELVFTCAGLKPGAKAKQRATSLVEARKD